MWTGYGSIPEGKQGIYLSIGESFVSSEALENTGSLMQVCGFEPLEQRIGELAEQKEITEAVVLVPFVDEPNKYGADTVNVGDRNFFSIDRKEFEKQKRNIDNGLPAISDDIPDTSISDMIRMAKHYYLPPQFDFMTQPLEKEEKPFVMYIHEFSHTLSRQDLVDIWQGVMPRIAQTAEEEEVEITHETGKHEFFHGKDIPAGVRWMIFKVKRRAERNYYDILDAEKEDERFHFSFDVGRKSPEYSYNWPYDFFSLVELARVKGGIVIEKVDEDADI